MRRFQSVILLVVLAIALFPWATLPLCPNSDGHHDGDKMHHGNCSEGMMDSSAAGDPSVSQVDTQPAFTFQAPTCNEATPAVDYYSPAQSFEVPNFQQIAILAVLFELVNPGLSGSRGYLPAPDFFNKSGPPLSANPLRGPPVLHLHEKQV